MATDDAALEDWAMEEHERREHKHARLQQMALIEPLLLDGFVTLINASYYQPARLQLHKAQAIELASDALNDRPDAQINCALALLQNLSLYPAAQGEIMRCRFMEARHCRPPSPPPPPSSPLLL